MTVLMTRRMADAIKSVERDRGLLTDRAADERIEAAEAGDERREPRRVRRDRGREEMRNRIGR